MDARTARERLRDAWELLVRGRAPTYAPRGGNGEWSPPVPPSDDEDALVPGGPPRRPLPSAEISLPVPEQEQWDVEAIGQSHDDAPADGVSQ
jgi:hypothetical protein